VYPYSQYEFNWDDGSPTIKLGKENKNKKVKPAVPDLIPIVLPVGEFETYKKTGGGSKPQLASSSHPTIGNIPTTTSEIGSEGKEVDPQRNERYVCVETSNLHNSLGDTINILSSHTSSLVIIRKSDQLSATGKKMLDQLPDLSYMLQSTLSLPSLKKRDCVKH
jgi:hypothetical protein